MAVTAQGGVQNSLIMSLVSGRVYSVEHALAVHTWHELNEESVNMAA